MKIFKTTIKSLQAQNADLKKKLENLNIIQEKVDLMIRDHIEMKENQNEILKIQRQLYEGINVIHKRTSKRHVVNEVSFLFLHFSISMRNLTDFCLRNLSRKLKANWV